MNRSQFVSKTKHKFLFPEIVLEKFKYGSGVSAYCINYNDSNFSVHPVEEYVVRVKQACYMTLNYHYKSLLLREGGRQRIIFLFPYKEYDGARKSWRAFSEWLLSDQSPFNPIFGTNGIIPLYSMVREGGTPSKALHGLMVDFLNLRESKLDHNLIVSNVKALTTTLRAITEEPVRVAFWNRLIEAGVDPAVAFFGASVIGSGDTPEEALTRDAFGINMGINTNHWPFNPGSLNLEAWKAGKQNPNFDGGVFKLYHLKSGQASKHFGMITGKINGKTSFDECVEVLKGLVT